MAISMKSALVVAILIIGLVQTAKSACPNYGKIYGGCGSDITSYNNVRDWKRCAELCKEHRTCAAWTYTDPQPGSDWYKKCWLHNSECGFKDSKRSGEHGVAGTYKCQG